MARNIDWRLGVAGGVLLILLVALIWKVMAGGDPATPTAKVEAGSSPVSNASEEAGGDFVLPQKK